MALNVPPKCINEGCGNDATFSSTSKDGRKRWRVHCSHCQGARYGKHAHRPGVKPYETGKCVNQDGRLGFPCPTDYTKAPHAIGVTDIDHIDGDHTNPDHGNLQELCPICHKLKGKLAGNYQGHRYAKISNGAHLIVHANLVTPASLFELLS
jgi:hypothetical protein